MAIQPWQYQLTEEDWRNLQPSAGIAKVANAISGGQQAYQQAQENALGLKAKQIATSPKQVVRPNATTGQVEQVGEVPAGGELLPVMQPTTKAIHIMGTDGILRTATEPMMGPDGKPALDPQGNPIMKEASIGKNDVIEKAPGTGGAAVKITDETAKGIADAIKSGKYPPAIVSKWFTPGRSGAGLENSNMILENLGFVDPVTGEAREFDLTDYTQSYNQEQKNKISYANAQNAIADMGLLVKGAEKIGNGNFKDWNRLKLNWQDRTGNDAVAAFKTEAQATIDSISLALGPAGGTGATNERLEVAKKMVDEAQSVGQIKNAMEAARKFVENRKKTFAHEGLAGFRERNGLAKNYTAPKESESFLSQENTKVVGGTTYKKVEGGWEAQ
jgi:hypothetical protein